MSEDAQTRSPNNAAFEGFHNKAYSSSADDVTGGERGRSRDRARAGGAPVEPEVGDYPASMLCGLGACKPGCFQAFNNPKAMLFWLCLFCFAQGFMVNGINNVNTSSLERRFELSSSQAGIISSSYDISAAVFSIPISYYGAHAHQPRMLSLAALVMACGAFVMSAPHFATGLYDLKESQSDECIVGTNNTLACNATGSGLSKWLGVFIIGMILNGIGGTTLYSLGIVFLDSSVIPRQAPLYQGIFYGASTLGPAFGYLLGGYLVQSFYVDVDKVDQNSIDVTEEDPRFVGAWWLGFLISGAFLIIVMFHLMWYPKELPASKNAKLNRQNEAHQSNLNSIASREGFGTRWRDMPVALKILLTNPVYVCLNLSGALEAFIVSGLATFLPKFIQNQFVVSAGFSAILAGAGSVTGAAGGQIAGGLACKLAKLRVRGMLKLNVCVSVLAVLLCAVFISRCSAARFAGVNVGYSNSTEPLGDVSLTSSCNADCGCTTLSYEPICGTDDVQYFSPCHAGCQKTQLDGMKVFVNCSCIDSDNNNTTAATGGFCDVDCTSMYIFLPIMFFAIFMVFMATIPSLTSTMRCIPESQRSFGVGVQWVFVRLLGSIPGPILMGVVFDSTCEVWQERCDGRGSCWIYDSGSLSVRITILAVVVKSFSTLTYVLALVLYKPPPGDEALQLSDDGDAVRRAGDKSVHAEGYVNHGADS